MHAPARTIATTLYNEVALQTDLLLGQLAPDVAVEAAGRNYRGKCTDNGKTMMKRNYKSSDGSRTQMGPRGPDL